MSKNSRNSTSNSHHTVMICARKGKRPRMKRFSTTVMVNVPPTAMSRASGAFRSRTMGPIKWERRPSPTPQASVMMKITTAIAPMKAALSVMRVLTIWSLYMAYAPRGEPLYCCRFIMGWRNAGRHPAQCWEMQLFSAYEGR